MCPQKHQEIKSARKRVGERGRERSRGGERERESNRRKNSNGEKLKLPTYKGKDMFI